MKIGQFAKKHGITHDTIRYYIEKGLLVPNKKDGQYRFNEVDSKEIVKIIELKQMQFSLSDIHRILTFQRLGGVSTEFSYKQFLSILEERQTAISEELLKLNRINDYLCKQIEEIKSSKQTEEQVLGFPITSTDLLLCPSSHKGLNLSAGVIEKNMIINADVECQCGYVAKIKSGIYIVEQDIRPKLIDGKPMPSKEEYLMQTPHNRITYLFKGMAQLIDYILKYHKEPGYIMELSNCVGFFLLQYINYLPEDCVYILIDFDIDRITHLKKNLERYYSHKKFIFFCCDYCNLPLKKSSVDVVVDMVICDEKETEYKKNLMDITTLLLKHKGIFAGKYTYSKVKEIKGDLLESKDNETSNKENILEKIKAFAKMKILDSIEISTPCKDYLQDINEKQVEEYQYVFVGKKL